MCSAIELNFPIKDGSKIISYSSVARYLFHVNVGVVMYCKPGVAPVTATEGRPLGLGWKCNITS